MVQEQKIAGMRCTESIGWPVGLGFLLLITIDRCWKTPPRRSVDQRKSAAESISWLQLYARDTDTYLPSPASFRVSSPFLSSNRQARAENVNVAVKRTEELAGLGKVYLIGPPLLR